MNYLSKCASRFATGIFAIGFALSLTPSGQAQSATQAAGDPSASSTSAAPAKTTEQQLQDLQKELAALQDQINSLKAQQNAPASLQAASYVQTPTPATDATKITMSGLLGSTTLSGFIDTYYGYNYNHPIDNTSGLRFFDGTTNGFGLNMAELILDKAPDTTSAESRFGYHVSAGYGEAASIINGTDPGTGFSTNDFYIKEAYGQYIAPIGKGLTIQVGKFVTPAGAEVIETSGNWNYSRSILFYYAIPFFHFGVNAKYTWNPKFSATFYLVNGWNNSAIFRAEGDGQSSGLTYGTSLAYTPNAKWSVTENYIAGPVSDLSVEQYDTANYIEVTDWKQLSDTVIGYTPNSKWAFTVNGDYGFGPKEYTYEPFSEACGFEGGAVYHAATLPHCVFQEGSAAKWWGAAGYAKYTMGPKAYFAMRYEYYDDPEGYTLFGGFDYSKGFAQEATGTYSYNLTSGLQVRGEYRYDFASNPIFQVGNNLDHFVKEQNTATLGFIYSFSSANAR